METSRGYICSQHLICGLQWTGGDKSECTYPESDSGRNFHSNLYSLESKAVWGYDKEFMEQCREELTLTSEYVRLHEVYVAEQHNQIVFEAGCQLPLPLRMDTEGRTDLWSCFLLVVENRKSCIWRFRQLAAMRRKHMPVAIQVRARIESNLLRLEGWKVDWASASAR